MARRLPLLVALLMAAACAPAQIIEFESGGLRYLTQSKGGLTVMFAHLPSIVRNYAIIQAAIANGSGATRVVRPEDFTYRRADGVLLRGLPAKTVVDELLEKASRNDVIRLVTTYEAGLVRFAAFRFDQRLPAAKAGGAGRSFFHPHQGCGCGFGHRACRNKIASR
jgi:hypothetical protein